MKKEIVIIMGCLLNFAIFADSTLTGNNGDAGDPNKKIVAAAANNAAATSGQSLAQSKIPTTVQTVDSQSQLLSPQEQQFVAEPSPSIQSDDASAQAMAQPAPANPNALGTTDVGRAAFVDVVHNLMPLNPQQIITLRNMFDQSQQAVAQYPGTPPKPTSSSIIVNMSPGSTPPVIRLRAGYVTSLVFLDSTGQPWPVVGYDLGNPKAFTIQPNVPDGKSSTLIVQSLVRYQQGNLAVMLKGESTPVMLTLMPGQRAVDYRVDLRIPGLGPNASVAMIGLPQAANPLLLTFLDGVPPQGARLLTVIGAPAQAWLYHSRIFLRTRVTILSPGWLATMSSPDGTHVFEFAKTPIVLASQRGAMVQLSIKGL